MKVKTCELTGYTLEWAVIYARSLETTGGAVILARDLAHTAMRNGSDLDFEALITQYRIRLIPWVRPVGAPMHGYWHAGIYGDSFDAKTYSGPTPRVAAFRCFVASRLGDEVDVPQLE